MRALTGWLGFPVVPANLAAITITSLVNFLSGDRWVFSAALGRKGRTVCFGKENTRASQP